MVSRGNDNSIAAGQVLFTGSSVVLKARPPSPDREIELALGGNYVYKDEAAYGATDEMSYMGSPKGSKSSKYRYLAMDCPAWEEAAIYVKEGEDNDKFYSHPNDKRSKLAYAILHHHGYNLVCLLVCVGLLFLTLFEEPAAIDPQQRQNETGGENNNSNRVIAGIEILMLLFLAAYLFLIMLWMGPLNYVKRFRTMLMTLFLLTLFLDALVVLIMARPHVRVVRALRPLFLIDTYLMFEVRRVIRQILLCLKRIADVLILLMFLLVFYSLIGYLSYSEVNLSYFSSLNQTILSMFILFTTANSPDVILEAYSQSNWAPVFYMVFLITTLYLGSNLLLPVVYSKFRDTEKEKFKKLFVHKREALRRAYAVLAGPNGIEFHEFLLFLQEYRPRTPEWQVMCMFKALQGDPNDPHSSLTLQQFYNFYSVTNCHWKLERHVKVHWFSRLPKHIRTALEALSRLVEWQWFNPIINCILLSDILFLLITMSQVEYPSGRYDAMLDVAPVFFFYISVYYLEITLKLLSSGLVAYFSVFWNIFDLVIVSISFLAHIIAVSGNPSVIFLGPLRIFRILFHKKRYRRILNVMLALMPRLVTIGLLLFVEYYCFAIIGMEFLRGRVYEGCCTGAYYGVAQYYKESLDSNSSNLFYLNNFDNVARSFVTLFELMVVNNWYITMEGFASQSSSPHLTRLFFMFFYICTLVTITVAISFMVDAFVFNVEAISEGRQQNDQANSPDDYDVQNVTKAVRLLKEDIVKLRYEVAYYDQAQPRGRFNRFIKRKRRIDLHSISDDLCYQGHRVNTREDIYMSIYRSSLIAWAQEFDEDRQLSLQPQSRHNSHDKLWRIATCLLAVVKYIVE
eukprot:Em0015g615a